MVSYVSADGKGVLLAGDSRALPAIPSRSVGVILTSPPYWVRGKGRRAATKYVRRLAGEFTPEWRRVLAANGDVWLIMGDRYDGQEWIGMDGLVVEQFTRAGWSLQAKGLWAEHPSTVRWDSRVNYLLRFKKAGVHSPPPRSTLCWRLPLPWSPRGSLWDAIPPPVIRQLLRLSRPGTVLDPFFGGGSVGAIAAELGRLWIGVERDRSQVRVAARRLRLKRLPEARGRSRTPGTQRIRPRLNLILNVSGAGKRKMGR